MLLIYGLRRNLAMQRRQKGLKNEQQYICLLTLLEFTDDDDGVIRVITDVVFSHEDDVYYAKYIIKGEKDIKKNHDYTILRQVFDMAREGGDDWVEDRFYKGKKIEQVEVGRLGRLGRVTRPIRLGIRTSSPT